LFLEGHFDIIALNMCRRILGPVYDNEEENWRILANKEIYANVKKTYYKETIRLNIMLVWVCTENGRK